MPNRLLRSIPSVNDLLETPALRKLVDKVSHNVVVSEARLFLDRLRDEIKTTAEDFQVPSAQELADRIATWISSEQRPMLRPVVNATGVLLHTGLGRAPLSCHALEEMTSLVSRYVTLEVDAETGERGQRLAAVEKLLTELTGAEAAAVVNNNAGATLLALAAVAAGKEVIVSRGQLIEIGGSYRLPEVMAAGGATLREVGTTNKTRIGDYEAACGEGTAALMRVHTSNYRVVGFTEETPLSQLIALARKRNLMVIDDIGSGALTDLREFGLEDEPVIGESIQAGADLVLFSGDKLLGGPQCGIIVGKREPVSRVIRHPLMRALRVDKMTLAMLAATLRMHRNPAEARRSIPLMILLSTSVDNLKNRAERMAPQLAACSVIETAEAMPETAQLGGGSVPAQSIPTWCVALSPRSITVDALAQRLRQGAPSVFGRIQRGRLLLDLRSVFASQDADIVRAVEALSPGTRETSVKGNEVNTPDAAD